MSTIICAAATKCASQGPVLVAVDPWLGGPGCFDADQSRCPDSLVSYCECDNQGCDPNCLGERGWWTQGWEAQLLFCDPAELARVAAGQITADQPQPYACMGLGDKLFLTELSDMLASEGRPPLRRYQLGAVAYDRIGGFLYLTELMADPELYGPVVHVWEVSE